MKNHIMTYNQLNESNELANLSFEEVGRLIDLGLIELSSDLLYIYDYVKNGSIGCLYLTDPKMKYLPSWLTKVDGSLYIADSGIEDIPDTLEITKNIAASYSKLKELSRKGVVSNSTGEYYFGDTYLGADLKTAAENINSKADLKSIKNEIMEK